MRRYLLSVGYFWAIFTCQDFMPGVWLMMCTFHFLLLCTEEASSPASFFAHPSLFFCRGAQGLLIEIGCSGSSPEFTSIHHEGVVNLSKLRFIPWRKQAWKSFMNNFPFLGSSCCSSFFVGFWFCCFMKNGGYDFCSIAPPTTNVSIISKEQSRWTNPLDFAWMNPWIKAPLHSVNILLPIFHEVLFLLQQQWWSVECNGSNEVSWDGEFFLLAEREKEMCNLYLPFFQLMLIVIYDFRLDNFSLA